MWGSSAPLKASPSRPRCSSGGRGGEAPEPVFGPSCAAGSNRVETETMGHTGLAAQVLEPRRQVLVMGKHLFPKSLGYENSSFYK